VAHRELRCRRAATERREAVAAARHVARREELRREAEDEAAVVCEAHIAEARGESSGEGPSGVCEGCSSPTVRG